MTEKQLLWGLCQFLTDQVNKDVEPLTKLIAEIHLANMKKIKKNTLSFSVSTEYFKKWIVALPWWRSG